jgi:Leucine zipper with capping helix domain
LERLRRDFETKERTLSELNASVEEMKAGREETAEHAGLIESLTTKAARSAALSAELSRFAAFDPEHVEMMKQSMAPVREAANRWTDNVFCCQSWVSDKFSIDRATFFQQFEIPENLDYLE